MKKLIAIFVFFQTTIAILLLSIAALLIWMPGLLIGSMRLGIVITCIIVGLCMMLPAILVISVIVIK